MNFAIQGKTALRFGAGGGLGSAIAMSLATDVGADSAASIPATRYGKPEEYADAVSLLANQRAAYTTGSILRIDGGF